MITSLDSVQKFTATLSSETDAILVTELLSQVALANSWWYDKVNMSWHIEILFHHDNLKQLHQFVRLINEAFKIALSDAEIVDLEQRDWLRENQESFPPLEIGNFYIYGSHITDPTPGALLPLKVDAATAFGSGNHGSTRGCLLALSQLRYNAFNPSSILDMGCGSGILAMAAAKLWTGAEITASDIDPECVRVTLENCELNHVNHIDVFDGNGFQNEKIVAKKPFDLIIANILATVLCEIAADICDALASDGTVVLSGILNTQQDTVVQKYESFGLSLQKSIPVDEWVTLIMKSNTL